MNKNTYNYLPRYCLLIIVFFLNFAISVSATQYTPKLPSGLARRFAAGRVRINTPEISYGIEERIRDLEKIKFFEPIKEKLSMIPKEEEIKKTGEVNNIYLYGESGNDGYRLTENMWKKSQTLKNELEDLLGWKEGEKIPSQVRAYPYSGEVIKTITHILKVCENASTEKPCNDSVKDIIESVGFQTVVSTLICADETLNIDKESLTELIEKVKQKITDLFAGKMISADDINALDTMALYSPLRKQLLGATWEVFVEKFKMSVVKKCSRINPDNQPKPYTYGDPGDSISGVLFSPNNKYLSIECRGSLDRGWRLKSSSVINMSTMHELKRAEKCNVLLWIDNDTFICAPFGDQSLMIFNCNGNEVVEKKKFKLTHNLFDVDIVHNLGNIMFSAWDSRTGIYIGSFNYNEPVGTVDYLNLTGIRGNYSKIIKIDSTGIEMVFDNQKNLREIGLYGLKTGKESDAQEMAKLDEIATFDGLVDSVVIDKNKNKLAVIVGKDRLNIGIYSFETKSYTIFKGNKVINSLAFSPDGKIIIAACSDELSIISAITGEKIGTFSSAGGQVFDHNLCVAFGNNDGTMLTIGREANRPGFIREVTNYVQEVLMIPSKPNYSEPNLLIWKWLPDKYVSIFTELYNKPFSFACIKLLVSLFNRTEDNKNPIQLTGDEKTTFEYLSNSELGLKIKNMLNETHYVSFPMTLPQSIQPKINEWQE